MATDVSSTICITTGEPGSGKTLSRGVIYAVEVYLRDKIGIMYHNLPLHHDVIADYCSRKYKKDKKDFLDRLVFITDDEIHLWRNNCFFDYFKDKDLHNAYVLIDEAHKYFGRENLTGQKKLIQDTEKYLSEFRHNGAKLELLTQSYASIHKIVRDRSGYAISIINFQDYPDVIFNIKMSEWLQLIAKFKGSYNSASLQIEYKVAEDKRKKLETKVWWHNTSYYSMYNTHNSSDGASSGADTKKLKQEWQLRSWPSLIYWFLRRNFLKIFFGSKITIIGWCLILFVLYGPKNLIVSYINQIESVMIKPDKAKINNSKNENLEKKEIEVVKKSEVDEEKELLKSQLIDLETYKKNVQNEMEKKSTIVLIDKDGLMLKDGSYFEINDILDFGKFKGKKINEIDIKKNRIYFSDGTFVALGTSLYEKNDRGREADNPEFIRDSENTERSKTGNIEFEKIGKIQGRGARSTTTH